MFAHAQVVSFTVTASKVGVDGNISFVGDGSQDPATPFAYNGTTLNNLLAAAATTVNAPNIPTLEDGVTPYDGQPITFSADSNGDVVLDTGVTVELTNGENPILEVKSSVDIVQELTNAGHTNNFTTFKLTEQAVGTAGDFTEVQFQVSGSQDLATNPILVTSNTNSGTRTIQIDFAWGATTTDLQNYWSTFDAACDAASVPRILLDVAAGQSLNLAFDHIF